MKILLDTHVFIWLIDEDNRLDSLWREEINNPQNQIFLSVASVWECVIKHQIGKLNSPQSPDIYFPQKRKEYLIKSLPINEESLSHLRQLPLLHKDPFDRLLISQSLQDDLTIMTEDNAILAYPNLNIFTAR
jgi:PIN domain nuclease of toxin-antitoxin system